MRQHVRVLGSFALATALAGCGGGGGGGGGSGSAPDRSPAVSANVNSVSVSGTPGDPAPTASVVLTLANVPTAGLFLDGEYSENGLDDVTSVTQSATQETVNLRFKRPSTLQNGTYGDTLTLRICNEDPCRTEIRGSPITINVSYQVTGTGRYSVIAGKTSVAMNTVDTAGNGVTDAVPLLVSPPPTEQLFFDVRSSTTGLASATARGTTNATVDLQFKPGMQLAPRAHDDTVTVRACYDSACIRQLTGSPLTISTRLTVAIAPEQGLDPLVVRSRTALPHNVIDAEYSNALDAIVMVSTFPSNALHVYSTATGTTRSQPLGKAPTSVSLAPNGLTAAVGHDALISVVELANVGQAGAPAPRLLNVSADVFDLVLDARGKVHAFPRIDQWVVAHTVDVASNVETLGTGTLRAGSHARLHPSGDFIYAADNGLSPSDIAKWNVASGTAQLLYDSPYHGQYAMCGNLWFDTPGNSIYTACGNTFRSSATQSLDMVYSGRLQLWSAALIGGTFQIGSLSHSTARGEVALVEYDGYACANFGSLPCNTHLATYESALLNRRTVHSIGPAIVSGTGYRQRGLFVFDQANGGRRFLISRLLGYPDPATEYQLSILD